MFSLAPNECNLLLFYPVYRALRERERERADSCERVREKTKCMFRKKSDIVVVY